jgi:hypothetical protein
VVQAGGDLLEPDDEAVGLSGLDDPLEVARLERERGSMKLRVVRRGLAQPGARGRGLRVGERDAAVVDQLEVFHDLSFGVD